jgi:hypothetical protein
MRKSFLAGALVVAVQLTALPAVAAEDAGQIKVVNGTVSLEREGRSLPAAIGTRVLQSDTLRTGAGSSVGVTLLDNTLLSAGPNSVLVIERFAFNSTTHQGRLDAGLRRGTLSMVSGKLAKQSPDAVRVVTPTSVLGARGTEFHVRVSE